MQGLETMMTFALEPPLQDGSLPFSRLYVWLAIVGFVLTVAVVVLVYLLLERHQKKLHRILEHPAWRRMDRLLSEHVPALWTFLRRRFTIREWRGLTLTVAAVVVFATIYLFILITESWVEEEALYTLDRQLYEWLVVAVDQRIASLMRFVTHLADGETVTFISLAMGLFFLIHRDRWMVVGLTLAVGVGSAVMHGLKYIFERSRPDEQLATAAGHSFPSGHAFLAMTLYGFLIFLVWRRVQSDVVRIGMTLGLGLLIPLVALSRVLLRVHWVSDVAGGMAIGLAWLVASLVLTRALQERYASSRRLRTEAMHTPGDYEKSPDDR